MGTQPQPWSRVAFGPFEYERSSGELRKHGIRLRLRGQPQQILQVLLDRPGEVIGRDQLQHELWSGTTFVDFEQGLNTAINKLRQALGDSADQPRYIETLPGRGYRFIGPLHRGPVKAVVEMTPLQPVAVPELSRSRNDLFRPGLWVLVAAIPIALLAGYWAGSHRTPAPALGRAQFQVTPPAGFALLAASSRQSFALSPDGGRVAFTALDSSGAFSVFVRELGTIEARPIPDTVGAHSLFWSRDGQSIFLSSRGKLRRIPLNGTAQQVLVDEPVTRPGTEIDAGRLLLPQFEGSMEVQLSGGKPRPLSQTYLWPQMLPDGEHLLYIAFDKRIGRFRARVVRYPDAASARDLLETDSRVLYTASSATPGAGYLMYVRAGSLLAQPFDARSLRLIGEPKPIVNKVYSFFATGGADFSVSDSGVLAYQNFISRSQLVWVDRAGTRLGTLGPANVNVKYGRISPDGRKVASAIYDVERGGTDIWVFDTATGAGRRTATGLGTMDSPLWSSDAGRIVFLHGLNLGPRIAIRGIGEKDQETLLGSTAFAYPTDWSRDGRFVAYTNTGLTRFGNEGSADVSLVDLTRNQTVTPLLYTQFNEANAVFSPDSKWVAFTSDESGQTEVYLQAFEGGDTPRVVGERHLVSRNGALCLRWRGDGKELFYLAYDGRVHAVPVSLGAKPAIGAATPLFQITLEARTAIHSIDGFDVSADGQRFLIPVVTSPVSASLVILQNWEAVLNIR